MNFAEDLEERCVKLEEELGLVFKRRDKEEGTKDSAMWLQLLQIMQE